MRAWGIGSWHRRIRGSRWRSRRSTRTHRAVGVAINSAPTEGVAVAPLTQLKATFPVFKSPANRHKAIGFTHEQWHYAFTNTFSDEESLALYKRYAIPASGVIVWGSVLANIQPGHQDAYVNYRNDARPRLLFLRAARTI